MVKHNNVVPNRHFHKDWQVRDCPGSGGSAPRMREGEGGLCASRLPSAWCARCALVCVLVVQVRVKTWFNQPGKKRSRRLKRDAKVRSRAGARLGASQNRGDTQACCHTRAACAACGTQTTAPPGLPPSRRACEGRGPAIGRSAGFRRLLTPLSHVPRRRPRRPSRARSPDRCAPPSARPRSATT